MRTDWPYVLPERETVALLVTNRLSISRYGDGELKILDGKEYVREPQNDALTAALRESFGNPPPGCVIGIPTFNPEGPKYAHWIRHEKRFLRRLEPARTYYSAFISRADSAPWINTPEYAYLMQKLWLGRRVAVLCEEGGSALRAVRLGAKYVEHVRCPTHGSFQYIDTLTEQVLGMRPDIAILSCGPTASIMAARLTKCGVQAIDFGSGGGFLSKLLTR